MTTVSKSDLGFACVVLGGVWTTAAVVLGFSIRGRSVLTLVALACLVGTIGCALLALAFLPKFTQRLRLLGWLSVAGGTLLAAEVVWSVWELPPEQLQWFADPGEALASSGLAVDISLIMLTASISLITTRLLSNQASRHHFAPLGAVQAIFLLFWRQHKLVGWMALALAAAHSVYFLRYPRGLEVQWTGIFGLVLLAALGAVGLLTSYRNSVALWTH